MLLLLLHSVRYIVPRRKSAHRSILVFVLHVEFRTKAALFQKEILPATRRLLIVVIFIKVLQVFAQIHHCGHGENSVGHLDLLELGLPQRRRNRLIVSCRTVWVHLMRVADQVERALAILRSVILQPVDCFAPRDPIHTQLPLSLSRFALSIGRILAVIIVQIRGIVISWIQNIVKNVPRLLLRQ